MSGAYNITEKRGATHSQTPHAPRLTWFVKIVAGFGRFFELEVNLTNRSTKMMFYRFAIEMACKDRRVTFISSFLCTSVIEFDQRMNFTTLITVVAVCSIWLDMAPTFARRRCWK